MKTHQRLMTLGIIALCPVWAAADRANLESQLRDTLGEGGVQTLEAVKERNPELHKRLRRFLRVMFSEEVGPRRLVRRVREFLADPKAREALVRNLDARFKVRKLLRLYDESSGAEKAALKAKLREAISERYEARLALQELHVQKLEERIRQAREQKESRIDKILDVVVAED